MSLNDSVDEDADSVALSSETKAGTAEPNLLASKWASQRHAIRIDEQYMNQEREKTEARIPARLAATGSTRGEIHGFEGATAG